MQKESAFVHNLALEYPFASSSDLGGIFCNPVLVQIFYQSIATYLGLGLPSQELILFRTANQTIYDYPLAGMHGRLGLPNLFDISSLFSVISTTKMTLAELLFKQTGSSLWHGYFEHVRRTGDSMYFNVHAGYILQLTDRELKTIKHIQDATKRGDSPSMFIAVENGVEPSALKNMDKACTKLEEHYISYVRLFDLFHLFLEMQRRMKDTQKCGRESVIIWNMLLEVLRSFVDTKTSMLMHAPIGNEPLDSLNFDEIDTAMLSDLFSMIQQTESFIILENQQKKHILHNNPLNDISEFYRVICILENFMKAGAFKRQSIATGQKS